jgi:hypothetical protein
VAENQSIKNNKLCETKPIFKKPKLNLSHYKIKDYVNNLRLLKMAKQTQSNPILSASGGFKRRSFGLSGIVGASILPAGFTGLAAAFQFMICDFRFTIALFRLPRCARNDETITLFLQRGGGRLL